MAAPAEHVTRISGPLARRMRILLCLSTLASLLSAPLGIGEAIAQPTPPMTSSGAELDPFEQRVRDYLLNNPEVILEAMQILQERQRAAEAERLERTIAERSDEILDDPDAPVGGNPSGDVTLVEFFDYNCPYCRKAAPTVAELEDSDENLRIVYKEFPILGPASEFASRAALASRNQDKYGQFHLALMQADERLTEAAVREIAVSVGLDIERLEQEMQDPAIQDAIARNARLANALGITGTPSFIVGEQLVPGLADLTTLQSLIERARREKQSGAPE